MSILFTTSRSVPAWVKWIGGALRESDERVRMRLFCFPYAGGSSSVYSNWHSAFPPEVEICPIQMPGRGNRWGEPPLSRMTTLVERLATDLHPLLNLPFAFFGHSMGALVAFELARKIRGWTGESPVLLLVSGARAPQIPDPEPPISALPDAAFLHRLIRLNGFPPEILENKEFIQAILPSLRADVALCETYRPAPGLLLDLPITAYGGYQDSRVPPFHVSAWRAQTTGRFRLRFFPGDHFLFFRSPRKDLTNTILEELKDHLARVEG